MNEVSTQTRTATATRPAVKRPRRWNVVLIDDDDHSYEYVIRMMMELFALDVSAAFRIAREVDQSGRAICLTTHREHGELKVEQIWGYGPDQVIAECRGSMTAILEPADDGDDEDA
ncbi:MAG: ATP-dependent Clp protease adaptor ClpS [Phycisphaerales bacterium]|nr:ATP-dependent Clp protease adaptor ClpS [Phycisphaerales bacterium]